MWGRPDGHNGQVRWEIQRKSVLFLLPGLFVIVLAFIGIKFTQLSSWLETPKETLREQELRSLGRIAEDKAVFASEVRCAKHPVISGVTSWVNPS
jgi:hypothetical protein